MNPHHVGTRVAHRNDHRVIEIDTSKAKYNGRAWQDLPALLKRKYENLLFLEPPRCPQWCALCAGERAEPLAFVYH